ncbi:hypothetical protein LCGC14_1245720 [marine sediment metagenome]|uniref:Uncharacterized protein n=1 Tax=marine sediment metagenome TaxID=412755 RepID=A0A0F9NLT0_9ZZZZ
MRLQYDHYGNFTIASDAEHVSEPALYNGIAALEVDGKVFIAISPHHGNNNLNPEKVYEVVPVETDVGLSVQSAPCSLFRPDEACPHGSIPGVGREG